MALTDLASWLDEYSGSEFIWYIKRLSANDTLANGNHQAGPYIAREFFFRVFPELNRPEEINPSIWFNLAVDSHSDRRAIRAIWYNNKKRGGTRDEARLTNFGGRSSVLLDPENTGALAVFVFRLKHSPPNEQECNVWVCDSLLEEDLVEDRIGPVEPGKWVIWSAETIVSFPKKPRVSCWLQKDEIPLTWLEKFPTAAEILLKTIEVREDGDIEPDLRLIRRRTCEYEIFQSVEEAVELPWIEKGFPSIEKFIVRAQKILQRRKARSGLSLELHIKQIFLEEELRENEYFTHKPTSESGKKPDFLFPSEASYHSAEFPDDRLRMLAVKTSCKDRWRQILNEADRIKTKHLLTLQEGVSENQFREMTQAGVVLVVPKPLMDFFPSSVRGHLQSLESFIADIRLLKKL